MALSIHKVNKIFVSTREKRERHWNTYKSTFRAYSKESTPTLKNYFPSPCFLLAILYPILLHSTLDLNRV